ncbi:MAG TPA: biopolymer transporter Tol, partial [Chloroflexota bacterium]|nr:biopolymer transporter Tol [Chloroflexota bacterium]
MSVVAQPRTGAALDAWRGAVRVSRVSRVDAQHAIHAYYTATPESPDGRYAVFYASTTPEAHAGELRLVDRASGEERVLARGITTEDSHRAACQQWASGGKDIVFHDVRGVAEQWVIAAIDVRSGEQRVLARDRQLGWGQPDADVVPVYG